MVVCESARSSQARIVSAISITREERAKARHVLARFPDLRYTDLVVIDVQKRAVSCAGVLSIARECLCEGVDCCPLDNTALFEPVSLSVDR
mgnify:CR=1 FL=1